MIKPAKGLWFSQSILFLERWRELRSDGQRVIRIPKFAFGRVTQELRAFWDKTEKRDKNKTSNRNCCYGDHKSKFEQPLNFGRNYV
jgi:hypothetical protein